MQSHVEAFFRGHPVEVRRFDRGPINRRVPNFEVACIGPGPKIGLWTYVTLGCWDAMHQGEHGLEFILVGSGDDDRHLETLAMNAYYHAGPESQHLDLGHTVPIGQPWVDDSACDHLLVCLPTRSAPL